VAAIAFGLSACRSSSAPNKAPAARGLVDARPYVMREPSHHAALAPLVVALHGRGGNAANLERSLGLRELGDENGFYLALPEGTRGGDGATFWNATDACCNFDGTEVDDVAYLDALLDDAIRRFPIDRARVYLVGFSNGAFMAHRYACERAERVAGIAALAGVTWLDESRCKPSAPVSVLQVHGDADEVVRYEGGVLPIREARAPFPGARATVERWAKLDACSPEAEHRALAPGVDSDRWDGCGRGATVELRTVRGGRHLLPLGRAQGEAIWSFLTAHPRTG
jgi:polyhydroxybutyrate depolymerase